MASECGPQFPAILEQPWALTLWTYYQVGERRRIADLIAQIDAVNRATLNALAFNEPNKLGIERDNALAAAKRMPVKDVPSDAEWRERAARLVAALEEGGVLSDA